MYTYWSTYVFKGDKKIEESSLKHYANGALFRGHYSNNIYKTFVIHVEYVLLMGELMNICEKKNIYSI